MTWNGENRRTNNSRLNIPALKNRIQQTALPEPLILRRGDKYRYHGIVAHATNFRQQHAIALGGDCKEIGIVKANQRKRREDPMYPDSLGAAKRFMKEEREKMRVFKNLQENSHQVTVRESDDLVFGTEVAEYLKSITTLISHLQNDR